MNLMDEDIKNIVEFLQNICVRYGIRGNCIDSNIILENLLTNFLNKYDLYKFKLLIVEERNNKLYIDISIHDGQTIYNVDSNGNIYKTRLYLKYK